MLQRIDSIQTKIEAQEEAEEYARLLEIGCDFTSGCQCDSCYTFSLSEMVTDSEIQDMDEKADAELFRMLCERAGSIDGLSDTIGRFE